MALRGLLWLALLFVLAVVLATVGHFDAGQVLIVYPPYRVDISLNLVVVGIIAAFILLYALIRIGRNECVVVIRVDKEKGYIDLSKRRVSPEDIVRCEEKFAKAKAVN